MRKLIAGLIVAVTLGGCVADQTRDNPNRELFDDSSIERETGRHGAAGFELARIWNTGRIAELRKDHTGESRGLELHEFYQVEIAEDPTRPTIVTPVGYVRLVVEDRGELMMYEFYDRAWTRIAYLGEDGSLYRYHRGREEFLGKHQLDGAVLTLYPASGGYGYDVELQEESIAYMHKADVMTRDSRGRGAHHRSHKDAPPIVNYRRYRPGEAAQLADRYERERFYERERERSERLKEAQGDRADHHDDAMSNTTRYRWKDGNPVDKDGRPVGPHHKELD